MNEMTRRDFVTKVGLGLTALSSIGVTDTAKASLQAREHWHVSAEEALAWHRVKDSHGGPTLTGSESWKNFVGFLEGQLASYGCVDFIRNRWNFDRWVTSEWPDSSHWTLTLNGQSVPVASYGANSGSTANEGVTAELVIYEPGKPLSAYTDKIVVFQPVVTPEQLKALDWDYEYASPAVGYPDPQRLPTQLHQSQAMPMFAQITQFPRVVPQLIEAKACGCLFVVDAGAEQAAGLYTFPVPPLHTLPSLYLDRKAGAAVIVAAATGERATLRLISRVETAEAWQSIAFLPGRHYGTPADEVIQLTTHTDGPSISQDNGALGILGVVKYFSHLPQGQRERSLMVFLDCRHYMPGDEQAFANQDWFALHPEARKNVVGLIHMEHLGQIGFYEDGYRLVPIGQTEPFSLWATDHQTMIDTAIRVVKETPLPGACVRDVDRPGVHGRSQGPWFGLGGVARQLGIPAFGIMGLLGAYWSSASRLNRLDAVLFAQQVAAFVRLTAALMQADLGTLRSKPVEGKEALKLVRPEH